MMDGMMRSQRRLFGGGEGAGGRKSYELSAVPGACGSSAEVGDHVSGARAQR